MSKLALKEAVNLLSRKAKENLLGTLDEKQIQERLYGKYHKQNQTQSVPPTKIQAQPFSANPPTPASPKVDFFRELKALANAWWQALLGFAKVFPWKMTVSAGVALIAVVLIGQAASHWFAGRKSAHQQVGEIKHLEPPKIQPIAPVAVKKTISSEALSAAQSSAAPAVQPSLKQKYYAVQVCTYQRQKDAEELVRQLQSLKFSAFYKQTYSQGERIPLYIVFLNRTETYAQAKAQLSEFRKTEIFQKFSDSFIQSL